MKTQAQRAILKRLIVQVEDPGKFIMTSHYLKMALSTLGLIGFVGAYIAVGMGTLSPKLGVIAGAVAGLCFGLSAMYSDKAETCGVLCQFLDPAWMRKKLPEFE